VSERRRAAQALRESEQQFRVLADSMPALAWSANPDGQVAWYNQRWYEYTGRSPEEMLEMGWEPVIEPAMLPQVWAEWKEAQASGRSFEMEIPLRAADGTFRWFLTRVLPIHDEQGRLSRWFGTNTDVTAMREAREVLARSKEQLEVVVAQRTAQLEEVVHELSAFSYSVSHDLRAPLRTITGFADLLRTDFADSLPAEARSHLERILRSGKRMDSLISDVLEYSRVSRAELNIECMDPEPLVREVAESFSGSKPDATIIVEGPFPRVRASRTALLQVLTNLLNNAVKFTRPGVAPVVLIGAVAGPTTTRFYVRDNGIGIAPEFRERIWGMFERLNTGVYDGSGVGLAIVKRAVDRMGGRVHVESEVGGGSKFAIELPNA
jgi:PAS domain S-box-containing protein